MLVGVMGVAAVAPALAEDQPLPLLRSMTLLPDEPNYADLAVGGYAVLGHHQLNQTIGGRAEVRFGEKWNYIGPAMGIVANVDGGFFVYAGGYTDIKWGPIVITPLVGVGADVQGDTHDLYLGGPFQFRLQLTTSYQFDDLSRIGLLIGHISNAHINKVNPGEDEFMLSYAFPLRL
jgi:hypothetical protein